jgi:hypothetical protein
VSINGFIESTDQFPSQKLAIFCEFEEVGGIARGRATVCQISDATNLSRCGVNDAEIVEKGHLWTENR